MRIIDKEKGAAHVFVMLVHRIRRKYCTRFWFFRFLVGSETAYGLHMRVKADGYEAYMQGAELDANPYPNAWGVDDLPHGAWKKGWHEAQAVIGQARQINAPSARALPASIVQRDPPESRL
ncbi:hypothetical protein [Burkholderia cepacia]|uniref:hypothetical protein n=1 Tax=Burkholderia cepacia TaxID=292 RepID=UPI000A7963B4|nr:hypothetical protein [Burkholderia cepacia]